MSGPALAGADPLAFGITVPHSWFELDVRPTSRDAAIQTLVQNRLREVPALWERRAAVVRLLRRQARDAWEAGAVYCACLVEPTGAGSVTASVTVSVVRGPSRPGEPPAMHELLGRLRPRARVDGDERWTTVDTVEVPGAGTAARAFGVEDVELPDSGGTIRVAQLQAFLPAPGTDKVVVVSCSSPVVPLADALIDVFDAIASTVRLVEPAVGSAAGSAPTPARPSEA